MELVPSKSFDTDLRKLLRKNPSLTPKVAKALKLLQGSPNHPSLRLHKLGNRDKYSISVDMKIRIIVYFESEYIFLLKIGNHDEVY